MVSLDELQEQTKQVLQLAKHVILYAVSAINLEESQKESDDNIVK